MDLNQLHKMSDELEIFLRMRFHPIAIKMLKSRDEVPEGAIIPSRDWKHKYSQCQTFARSQRDGLTIAMFLEDSWCPEPVMGYGFVEKTKYFTDGTHRYPDSVRTLEAGGVWCSNMPTFDYGKYIGIVSAPLGSCNFEPDLIMMHVNGLQTSQLCIIKNWMDGKDLHCQISGHAACVYGVVPAIKNDECYVAIPCKGDRRLAGAQDDEIIFAMPPRMLPDFIEGIHFLQDKTWGLPLKLALKEEYDTKPGYKKFAEEIGMDMRQSPPREQKYQHI